MKKIEILLVLAVTILFGAVVMSVPGQQATAPKPSANDLECTGCVDTADIADNAVTTSKIADNTIVRADISPSFMKFVQLLDDAAGNAKGWNPPDTGLFFIVDADIKSNSIVSISIKSTDPNHFCGNAALFPESGGFDIACGVGEGDILNYAVVNP